MRVLAQRPHFSVGDFITELLRHSEDFHPKANILELGLVQPDYDDEAFAETAASIAEWEDHEDEPE